MLYEWRVYEIVPGRMNAINDRFQKITTKYFDKYGIKVVGFWQAEIGTSNVLYYMLAWESLAQREKLWSAFQADPERLKAFRETEKDGPIVERVINTILRPTAYSPMK
jgi:NIPSNAP